MSRFGFLKQKYDELKSADNEYWLDLRNTVQEIYSSFGRYLELPDPIHKATGESEKWLYLGKVSDSKFTECEPAHLEKAERFLRFTIGLALSTEFSEKPKSFHTISLMIVKNGETHLVASQGGSVPQVVIKNRNFGELLSVLDRRFEELVSQR
jgi:hypothetical protein